MNNAIAPANIDENKNLLTPGASMGRGAGRIDMRDWSVGILGTIAIIAILLLGFILRVWGLRFGLPELLHPDEWAIVDPAMMMLRTGDYNPHDFQYPTFYIYNEALVFAVRFILGAARGDFQSLDVVAIPGMYTWGRLLTAIYGTANVFIIYKTGFKLFDRLTGIIGALFLAVAFLHVRDSHYVTIDVPAATLSTLSFYFACSIFKTGEWKYYILSGATAGLATAMKWNAAPVLVCLIAAHFIREARKEPINGRLFTGIGAFIAGVFIASPYAFIDLPDFISTFGGVLGHYRRGHPGYEAQIPILYYLRNIASLEGASALMAAAAAGGLIVSAIKLRAKGLFLVSFPVLYLIIISFSKVTFPRTAMPLYPFITLFAAYFVVYFINTVKERSKITDTSAMAMVVLIALVIASPPLVRSIQYGIGSSTTSTKVLAGAWIKENIEPGSKIVAEFYSPPISGDYKVDRVSYLDNSLTWFKAQDYDYMIFDGTNYQRYYEEPLRYKKEVKKYDELMATAKVIKEFNEDPRVELFLSPDIKIVRLSDE